LTKLKTSLKQHRINIWKMNGTIDLIMCRRRHGYTELKYLKFNLNVKELMIIENLFPELLKIN
jgi:hypothetical protein